MNGAAVFFETGIGSKPLPCEMSVKNAIQQGCGNSVWIRRDSVHFRLRRKKPAACASRVNPKGLGTFFACGEKNLRPALRE